MKLGGRGCGDRMNAICRQPAGDECKKTCVVFSPQPDDDVISMGGTIIRLAEQGHKIFIAYMTSGNIAVFDHDAWRFIDFAAEFNRLFEIDKEHTECVKERVQDFLRRKKPGQLDSEDLLKIKAVIRQTEARAAALACGIPPEQLEFMDLRFYRTGKIAKAPIHPQDINDIRALLERLQPAQIYVAAGLFSPPGTPRTCAQAGFQGVCGFGRSQEEFEEWLFRCARARSGPPQVKR